MLYPLSWKSKTLVFLATALLLTTTVAKASCPLDFSSPRSHISGISTLYLFRKSGPLQNMPRFPETINVCPSDNEPEVRSGIDTAWLSPVTEERIASKYVRKEKNSDLAIRVPSFRGRYRIRFFDDRDQFLFEIRQIRDSLLIVEKVNFRHTGLFRYELYKDNLLVERNSFTIKSNP